MDASRKESDLLGELAVPADALHGIYTVRAIENFPLADVNLHQSTNDTYPTALRVAAIWQLRNLEREAVALVPAIGYEAAQGVAEAARAEGKTVRAVVLERGLLTAKQFDESISPEAVMRPGSPAR